MRQAAIYGGLFLKKFAESDRRFAASGNVKVIDVRYLIRMKHGGMAKLWEKTVKNAQMPLL